MIIYASSSTFGTRGAPLMVDKREKQQKGGGRRGGRVFFFFFFFLSSPADQQNNVVESSPQYVQDGKVLQEDTVLVVMAIIVMYQGCPRKGSSKILYFPQRLLVMAIVMYQSLLSERSFALLNNSVSSKISTKR